MPAARPCIHKGVNGIRTQPSYGEFGLEESLIDDINFSWISLAYVSAMVGWFAILRLSTGALPIGYPNVCRPLGNME